MRGLCIYNVVGGFVAMFSIISGSMTLAVNRFITIEIGKDNVLQATRIFSTSVIIPFAFLNSGLYRLRNFLAYGS